MDSFSRFDVLLLRWGYYFLMDSIAVSYMKILFWYGFFFVFPCVDASMGLLFLMDSIAVSYMKILF